MMNYYGYHRTSTKEQHLDRGIWEITEYCKKNSFVLTKIYTDQQTGKNFNRPRYTVLKEDILRPGDTLIITELDRLGRTKKDTMMELEYFKEHSIRVMILEIPTTCQNFTYLNNDMGELLMETINNMLIELYAAIAQSEIQKKEKRQQEGIQAMKERGEWENYGRPRTLKMQEFAREYQKVKNGELRPYEFMSQFKLSKATYYRYRNELFKSKDIIYKEN